MNDTHAEARAGTYAKIVTTPGPPRSNTDSFLILYLRPVGTFLFLGYWPGYEASVAAGRWSVNGRTLELDGYGHVHNDAQPGPGRGRFRRAFTSEMVECSPILTAGSEVSGWSLLGWAGVYSYLGSEAVFDPDAKWLPRSMADVDSWIGRMVLGPTG